MFTKKFKGFLADRVVYNLLCLLHTGGNIHPAIGIGLDLLPCELCDVAFSYSCEASEKKDTS